MSHEFHTEEYKGCTIRIVQDEHPEDPRTDYDHLGTMVPWDNERRGYVCKDMDDYDRESFLRGLAANQLAVRAKLVGKEYSDYAVEDDDPDYMNLPDTEDLVEMACADNVILPYDYYSGSQGGVREGDWERSTGYIWMTMDDARKNWPGVSDDEVRKQAEACLRAEIEELNNWIQGNVAGWIAEDPDGETIESVWGYYPDEYPKEWDYPISEARAAIDRWVEDQHELALQECMNI